MIKARACAGDIAAGETILNELSPFVWRRYLDFASVADAARHEAADQRISWHGEIAVEGHNIKLGRGGIREIEFFAQTQQLIAAWPQSGAARSRYADELNKLEHGPPDRRRRARRHEGGLLLPAHCRASSADAQRRADPGVAAYRTRATRPLCATSLRRTSPSQKYSSVTLRRSSDTTPGCSRPRPAADRPALEFPPDADDREDARFSPASWASQAAEAWAIIRNCLPVAIDR